MEYTINEDKWFFISNGYYYLYIDDKSKKLKCSKSINIDIIYNYLFKFEKAKTYKNPNLYFNYYNVKYDSIDGYNLKCKAFQDSYVYPNNINKTLNSIQINNNVIKNGHWLLMDYNGVNENNNDIFVHNIIYIDRNTNKQGWLTKNKNEICLSSFNDINARLQEISYVVGQKPPEHTEDSLIFYTDNFKSDDLYETKLYQVFGKNDTIYVFIDKDSIS